MHPRQVYSSKCCGQGPIEKFVLDIENEKKPRLAFAPVQQSAATQHSAFVFSKGVVDINVVLFHHSCSLEYAFGTAAYI
jgi:hypothetical protein